MSEYLIVNNNTSHKETFVSMHGLPKGIKKYQRISPWVLEVHRQILVYYIFRKNILKSPLSCSGFHSVQRILAR